VSDHWHYSSDIHGGAEEHHRHHDIERELASLRNDMNILTERVRELESRTSERISNANDV